MARVPNLNPETQTSDEAEPTKVKVDKVVDAKPPAGPPPEIRKFRVIKGGRINTSDGYMTRLHDGKVIDDHNYNIARLKQQGIRLEPYRDEE
jgi:hypothetical protein